MTTRSINDITYDWLLGYLTCFYEQLKQNKEKLLRNLTKEQLYIIYETVSPWER